MNVTPRPKLALQAKRTESFCAWLKLLATIFFLLSTVASSIN